MSRSISRWASRVALAAFAGGVALTAGTSARAAAMRADWFHVALIKAEPKLNDTLTTSPKAIKLWFSESIQAGATAIRLTAPEGKIVPLGKVTVAPAPKSPATALIGVTLEPGRYSIDWRTMAEDGHPAKGTLTFVVR